MIEIICVFGPDDDRRSMRRTEVLATVGSPIRGKAHAVYPSDCDACLYDQISRYIRR
jgi:hypothetical protein